MNKSLYQRIIPRKGSWNHGEIVPLGSPLEVTPEDKFIIDVSSVIRMATPIAPIMSAIECDMYAFFVPNRLCSDEEGTEKANNKTLWERIIGNGTGNPADWQQTDKEVYQMTKVAYNPTTAKNNPYTSIGEALGLGVGIGSTSTNKNLSALQLFGYNLIYNESFRDENVEAYKTLNATSNKYGYAYTTPDDTDDMETYIEQPYNACLSVAYKKADRFTNALPAPQKGPSIALPLGNTAPVIAGQDMTEWGNYGLQFLTGSNKTNGAYYDLKLFGNGTNKTSIGTASSSAEGTGSIVDTIFGSNLYTDLTEATAAKITDFVTAFNLQQLLMTDAKGTRYFEILKNHYGSYNPELVLQRPECVGHRHFYINVNQVIQTSGAEAETSGTSQNNILGTTGAYSLTGDKGHLVSQTFHEHGLIYILVVCRHERGYGQGAPKQFERSTRFDWFWPELGNIGYQEIHKSQLDINKMDDGTIFGYEPAWEELRRIGDAQSFGFMNPAKSNSLDYWNLDENFANMPTLSMSFLKEDREALKRALTIQDGPDYIGDFAIAVKKETLVQADTRLKLRM